MKLSIRAFALTAGLLWGGCVLLMGLANMAFPSYGLAFLEFCSSIYPGYHVAQTFGSVITGTMYGLVDGGIGGAIFAWIYNLLVGKTG